MRARLAASSVFLAMALGSATAQSTTDALHYRLEIELHFATRTITATNHATFRSLADNLKSIDLDLHSQLVVSSVKMGGKNVAFTRPAHKIHITLDRPYKKGESFTVDVAYGGTPPRGSGFAGLVFTTHSGARMAWTLSEPWDAKAWWPGKDILVDKSTFDMWIIHPNTMTAVSNGTLQGKDSLPGNRIRTRWHEGYPIVPYLVSLAVTNYRTRTDTYSNLGATMPVEFYVFPESWNSWQGGMNLIVPMLKAFASAYGQYPFVKEKYGIAQFTWGGGMEHQTITSQVSATEWLSAHELSHQWWGDMVTCATWHDIWLNEGFATFSEAVYYERKAGGSLAAYHNWIRRRRPSYYSGTVYVYNATSVGRIFNSNNVYRKGGWVLHQLRHVLGDKTFFQCLADYRKAFEGGSATTADFRRVCEQTSGRDLRWFFDEWVMKGGAPSYRYGWTNRRLNGTDYLALEIDQAQASPAVMPMPIDVRVRTTAGTETHVVQDDERLDQFAIPLKGAAQSVTLDPDQWILRQWIQSRAYLAPFFAASPEQLTVATGGPVRFLIDRGSAGASRLYLTLAGLSGSQPGTRVGTLRIPLNFDPLTDLGLAALNTGVFTGFFGKLDAGGKGSSTLNVPPGLGAALKGKTLSACYVLVDRLDFASRAVRVALR